MAEQLTSAVPVNVPKDLTRPSRHYKRRVWLALGALLVFVGLYLALSGWFLWSAYRMVRGAFGGGRQAATGFFAALPMAFLSLFMLKALLFRDKAQRSHDLEITPQQEPQVFEFLWQIADAAGAPRPHRVYLSHPVNASVFYDLSILNLIVPSRKNLSIGLGLINVLSLAEARAVLAHEFGHFGQRAMAVGRWVYVAQRIAAQSVNKRDALDRFLLAISRTDIRIAWIGWSMRILVWALRSVLDTVFSVVVLAERALSREMEMQADLVAVSQTGSDALVHALHKLPAADAALDQALSIAALQYRNGKAITDLFALQTRVMCRARDVLADPTHGVAPPLPAEQRDQHRVFQARMAHPPRMWSTHPPNHEREENAKRVYLPCELDDRSAWLLFRDPAALREQATRAILDLLPKPEGDVRNCTPDEQFAAVDQRFERAYLDSRYRGAYLRRSVVRNYAQLSDLYLPPERRNEAQLDELYPEGLRRALERCQSLEEERDLLQGLRRGVLEAGSGNIRFRGGVLRRRDLSRTLDAVSHECKQAREQLEDFDRRHRTAHLVAAEQIGHGWPEYLKSLLALLHYADHTEANLRDARGHLSNVFAVVTADGKVSKRERQRLVAAGIEVQHALQQAFEQRTEVRLPAGVSQELGVADWPSALPTTYTLGLPSQENIGEWLNVVDSWLDAFIDPFDVLERCTLELLLKAEAKVEAIVREQVPLEPAPSPATVPLQYPRLLPGNERERQWKLGAWDRFQIAEGFGFSLARFAVASGFVAVTVLASASVGDSHVVVYNGLGRTVVTDLGGKRMTLRPGQASRSSPVDVTRLHVRAESLDGELIEDFTAELPDSFTQYVYNVAGAAPLVRWTAAYGTAAQEPSQVLGAPRWSSTNASVLFEEPPRSVSTKGGGATRRVLSAARDIHPRQALGLLTNAADRTRLIATHARWVDSDQPFALDWLELAAELPDFGALLKKRLARAPTDVLTLREEQTHSQGLDHEAVCRRHRELSDKSPQNADLLYLALRCDNSGPARDQRIVAARAESPHNPWIALLASDVYERHDDCEHALGSLRLARSIQAMSEHTVFDEARVLRLRGRTDELSRLASSWPSLRQRLVVETPAESLDESPLSPILRAYQHLAHGRLDAALHEAPEPQRPRLLRLVGASRNASPAQVQAALALDDAEGSDDFTLTASIGLLIRHGRNPDTLVHRLSSSLGPSEMEAVRAFMQPDQIVGKPEAEALAHRFAYARRGALYVLGAVILGDRTPEAWLHGLRAVLFPDEHPYL